MHKKTNRITAFFFIILFFTIIAPEPGACFSDTVLDVNFQPVATDKPFRRAVSLVPTITEIICAFGAQGALKGITYHDTDLAPDNEIAIVGGFSAPSLNAIASLEPDIIFISDMHLAVEERFAGSHTPVLFLETSTLDKSFETIHQLGLLFGKEQQAAGLIENIRAELALIAEKTGRIPGKDKQRVIRLMGGDKVMTPGRNSFQNEMIRAAGGIAHEIERNGAVIPVTVDQWQAFDPQVVYGCHGDEHTAAAFFNRPGWKDVAAVRNGRLYYFPCDLTCRAAAHTGDFVSWLAATIYTEAFSDPENLVLKEEVIQTDDLSPKNDFPPFIRKAGIRRSRIYDFVHKTLVLDFAEPMSVLSTLEGHRDDIRAVGNHYFPPPCWPISHRVGLDAFEAHVFKALDYNSASSAFLFTGADMDNLSVGRASFRDLTVWACVTAGVRSNALRMGADEGFFYEPGTINIIILADRPLSRRAMTRAVITATEAKTAALLDMDVRTCQNHGRYRATGTGTDNIIVVQGAGEQKPLENAGGHSRLGQLIAGAVYDGVREAVKKQNHLTEKRDVFRRLAERDISLYGLVDPAACDCNRPANAVVADLETALLDPACAGFMESALAVSDDYDKGLLTDLTAFNLMALDICSQVAEKEVTQIKDYIGRDDLPAVIKTALNALLTGIYEKHRGQ